MSTRVDCGLTEDFAALHGHKDFIMVWKLFYVYDSSIRSLHYSNIRWRPGWNFSSRIHYAGRFENPDISKGVVSHGFHIYLSDNARYFSQSILKALDNGELLLGTLLAPMSDFVACGADQRAVFASLYFPEPEYQRVLDVGMSRRAVVAG